MANFSLNPHGYPAQAACARDADSRSRRVDLSRPVLDVSAHRLGALGGVLRDQKPVKVAIIGGGCASIATAFELSRPQHQGKYAITIYQVGWRLGGKGASGRGPANRIEEHGLHVWMGFYENAFRLIRAAYTELGRPPGAPLATWEDAFKKHSFIVVDENIKGNWKTWCLMFPTNNLTPGEGGE